MTNTPRPLIQEVLTQTTNTPNILSRRFSHRRQIPQNILSRRFSHRLLRAVANHDRQVVHLGRSPALHGGEY